MAIYVPPTPIVDPASYRLGPAGLMATFNPPAVPPATGGNSWSFAGTSQTIHPDQLDQLAGKMERLLLQDFSEKSEFTTADIDPVLAPDGSVIAAGFAVKLNQVNDLPTGWDIGIWHPDQVTGWSLVEMIRSKLGIGTRYVP